MTSPQPQQQPADATTPQQVVSQMIHTHLLALLEQMIHTHLLAMIEDIDLLAWQAERDGTPLSSAERTALLEQKNLVLTWMGELDEHGR